MHTPASRLFEIKAGSGHQKVDAGYDFLFV